MLLDILLKNKVPVWATFLLVLTITVTGIPKLSVTPDNRVFYGSDNPRYLQLLDFEREFGANSNVIFVVHCERALEFCPELAAATREVTRKAALIEGVTQVESLATYPILESTPDTVSSSSFLDVACTSQCLLDDIDSRDKQRLIGRFANEDFSTLAVIAKLDLDINDPEAVSRIYEQSSLVTKSLPEGISAHMVGTIPLMNAFLDATYNELSGVMLVAGILIFLTLYFTLGSLALTGFVVSLGFTTIVVTLGIAGWTGLTLNTASATIPLILFTLVVAASMHFFMSIVRSVTDNPAIGIHSATAAALSSQSKPVILTAVTTVACMLSLITVSSPPVQNIGVWTSVGVGVGTCLLLLVVPVALSSLNSLPRSRWHRWIQPILNTQARAIERRRATSIMVIGITVGTLVSILLLEVNDDFIRFFDRDNQFRSSSEWVSQEILGPNNVEVVLDAGTEDGVFGPEYISDLLLLTRKLRLRPEVANIYSLLDVLEPINRHLGSGNELNSLSAAELAQLFLAYELSLEYGKTTRDLLSPRRTASRVSLVVEDITAREIRELEQAILSIQPQLKSSSLTVTGESIPISHLSPANIFSMTASIVLTFFITALALAAFFMRWRIAAIAIVSTVIPVICGFGIWGLFFDSIGLATTVIVAVCMGVVIDDTIHMIYTHIDAMKRLNLDSRQASAYAVHRVGSAMLTTTVVLGLGFGVMLLSDFQLNSSFGGCSALILVCALVFDLRILPEMLVWASAEEPRKKK